MSTSNTIDDLCKAVKALRDDHPNMRSIAFELPGVGHLELNLLQRLPTSPKTDESKTK